MTIAIGINFGTYILLAADTRTINYDWSGKFINFIDDSEKIIRTKIGLMTGAGNLALLEAVKEELSEQEVLDTNEITKIIKEKKAHIKNLASFAGLEMFNELIESTGWIFTYVTPKKNKSVLRLGVYSASVGTEIGLMENNIPGAILPQETSKKEQMELTKALEKLIKPINEFDNFGDSVKYHIECIGSFIDLIQPNYPSISSSSQFGIHAIEGIWISPIIKPREEISLNIKLDYESNK